VKDEENHQSLTYPVSDLLLLTLLLIMQHTVKIYRRDWQYVSKHLSPTPNREALLASRFHRIVRREIYHFAIR